MGAKEAACCCPIASKRAEEGRGCNSNNPFRDRTLDGPQPYISPIHTQVSVSSHQVIVAKMEHFTCITCTFPLNVLVVVWDIGKPMHNI